MKIKNVLKAAAGVAAAMIPGGPAALAVVNAFLPDGEQLPSDATGAQIAARIDQLPPDQRALILSKEVDLEIAESNNFAAIVAAMADVDKTGNSTRPFIAALMAWAVFAAVIVVVAAFALSAYQTAEPLKEIGDSWELMTAVLLIPSIVLRSYFGLRTSEKRARYAAATGQEIGAAGGLTDLIAMFRKGEMK